MIPPTDPFSLESLRVPSERGIQRDDSTAGPHEANRNSYLSIYDETESQISNPLYAQGNGTDYEIPTPRGTLDRVDEAPLGDDDYTRLTVINPVNHYTGLTL